MAKQKAHLKFRNEEQFAHPPEDREWMALQQHVIDLSGKPIEDLTWADLCALRQAMTDPEMAALRDYRRRKKLAESLAFKNIPAQRPRLARTTQRRQGTKSAKRKGMRRP